MNTDPFNDSIRRKLESIRPDFSDKDWVRMQATLQQAAPPPSGTPTTHPVTGSAWSAQPWLLAAATVSTVVLISVAVWQRNQITHLQERVSRLSHSQPVKPGPGQMPTSTDESSAVTRAPAQPANRRDESPAAPPADRSSAGAHGNQPDTVYVTKYVPIQPASPAPDQVTRRSPAAPDRPLIDRASPTRSAANDQRPQRQATPSLPTDRSSAVATNAPPVADETTSNPATVRSNRPDAVDASPRRTDGKIARHTSTQPKNDWKTGRGKRSSANIPLPVAVDEATAGNQPTAAPVGSITSNGAPDATPGQPTATYEPATNRPLTLPTTDWNEALARQAKRMRPVRTTTVAGPEATVNQPASQPVRVAFGLRVGAGGELSRAVRSGSVLTELLLGKHLTLGVGIGLASFAGGTFTTDVDFDRHRRKPEYEKFRRDYARGINPLSDIVNIGMHTVRVQLPVSIGYRIPVSPTLSLLPSVGTTLSLRSREYVSFTLRQPFGVYEPADRQINRPVNLLNNLTFGAGVEWKRNHWVVQAGPVLTVPTVADANWQETTSLGLRARVFYQF